MIRVQAKGYWRVSPSFWAEELLAAGDRSFDKLARRSLNRRPLRVRLFCDDGIAHDTHSRLPGSIFDRGKNTALGRLRKCERAMI